MELFISVISLLWLTITDLTTKETRIKYVTYIMMIILLICAIGYFLGRVIGRNNYKVTFKLVQFVSVCSSSFSLFNAGETNYYVFIRCQFLLKRKVVLQNYLMLIYCSLCSKFSYFTFHLPSYNSDYKDTI